MINRAVESGRGYGPFHHTAYNVASAYAALNEPEQAVRWLEPPLTTAFRTMHISLSIQT